MLDTFLMPEELAGPVFSSAILEGIVAVAAGEEICMLLYVAAKSKW